MSDTPDAPERFAPDKLLYGFTRTPFLKYLLLAVVVHVLLTAATSVPYALDRIYPERVEAREKARKERERQEAEAKRPKTPATSQSSTNEAATNVASSAGSAAPAGAPTSEAELLKAHSNAPVVKQITEMPKPGEIPHAPDDLGISIDQTNPR
jgi:hypothetical protein